MCDKSQIVPLQTLRKARLRFTGLWQGGANSIASAFSCSVSLRIQAIGLRPQGSRSLCQIAILWGQIRLKQLFWWAVCGHGHSARVLVAIATYAWIMEIPCSRILLFCPWSPSLPSTPSMLLAVAFLPLHGLSLPFLNWLDGTRKTADRHSNCREWEADGITVSPKILHAVSFDRETSLCCVAASKFQRAIHSSERGQLLQLGNSTDGST